jgi:outer membrane autotransporter protein
LHRYAPSLLFSLAGFLFSNPVYAQLPPPVDAGAVDNITVLGGTYTITGVPVVLFAHDGGTITTGPAPPLTITAPGVTGAGITNGGKITITDATFIDVANGLQIGIGIGPENGGTINATNLTIVGAAPNGATALVPGSTITLHGGSITSAPGSIVQSTGVKAQNGATLIADGTSINGSFRNSAQATAGGHIELSNLSITQNHVSAGPAFGALETATGGTISADHVQITTGTPLNRGVFVQGGSVLLTNSTVTTTADSSNGVRAEVGFDGGPGTIEADNTVITTSGQGSHGAIAVGAPINLATLNLNGSTVTTTGANANGIYAFFEATLSARNSTVSAQAATANAGQVADQSVMNITDSKLTGGANGIRITDDVHNLGPNTLTVSRSTITATAAGAGEAAFRVDGAKANITLNSVTVTPGAQNLLLNVTSVDSNAAHFGSVVDFTVHGSALAGDILAEADSVANINLVDNSSLQGIINGANDVLVGDHSVWTTPNNSMLVGNLALQSGILVVNSTAKFASSGQASVVTIGGNFSMNSASTLSLGIGGLNGSQYDHLLVGKNAEVAGTLNVSSLGGFHPANLNLFEIIRSGTTTSGARFATVNDGINNNPNLQRVDIYAPNGVALLYVAVTPPGPTPIPTPPPAPTSSPPPAPTSSPPPAPTSSPPPNPRPPINIIVPEPLPPVNPEEPIPLKANRVLAQFLLSFLDPTVEQLTSMFEIPFSGANTQRFNLTDRMTQIQRGSTGFVSAVPPTPAPIPTGKEIWEKEVVPPALVPGPTNRWGVWVNGWGDWVNVNDDNGAKGYNFTTGGVSVGVDYRITDNLAVGIFGAYAHTWTSLNPGSIDVNTGRGGLYATYWNQGFYINGGVYAGGNSYDTSRGELTNTLANGSTSGYEVSTFVGTGYDFHFGDLSLGPVFAAQYTTVHIDGFTERGSVLPLNIHSDSEESWRTDLGVRASYTWHVGNIIVIPSLWAAWEHEYKYSRLPITFSSPILGGVSATAFGPHEGHDSAIINAGVGTQWTPRISTYVGYQGQLGRHNYDAHGVTGTIIFSF